MDVIDGYFSTFDNVEDGEEFYLHCTLKDEYINFLSGNDHILYSIPSTEVNKKNKVIKTRPRKVVQ